MNNFAKYKKPIIKICDQKYMDGYRRGMHWAMPLNKRYEADLIVLINIDGGYAHVIKDRYGKNDRIINKGKEYTLLLLKANC